MPLRTCPQVLVVQLGRLPAGDYVLDIAGDGYVNQCQLTGGDRGGLWSICRPSEGVFWGPDNLRFPVQLGEVKLELRRGAETVLAGTFTPSEFTGTSGCMTQTVYLEGELSPRTRAP